MRHHSGALLAVLTTCLPAAAGCSGDSSPGVDAALDLSRPAENDAAVAPEPDLAVIIKPDECGWLIPDPGCRVSRLGGPDGFFPLQSDMPRFPRETDSGLRRGPAGELRLASDIAPAKGVYTVLFPGCRDELGYLQDTMWFVAYWDADVPPHTSLRVRAKAADVGKLGDPSWAAAPWTPDTPVSPLLLMGELMPNLTPDDPNATVHDKWLLLELRFESSQPGVSPLLREIRIAYMCNDPHDG